MYVDTFGSATSDLIAVGDYDGDNKSDLAVWRSQIGASPFITRNTRSSPFTTIWGQSTGVGVSPDYPVANFSVK